MKTYETVTQAINDLTARGYEISFSLEQDYLHAPQRQCRLSPKEFQVDEFHRFEGETDPGDEMIVYAISAIDGSVKGTLVNAYGTYADTASDALVSKLRTHPNEN